MKDREIKVCETLTLVQISKAQAGSNRATGI